MSREGRKRRKGMKWTPWKGKAISIRDLTDEHLANILWMVRTGEVKAGGSIVDNYQMAERKRLMLKDQWEERIIAEQARRLKMEVDFG